MSLQMQGARTCMRVYACMHEHAGGGIPNVVTNQTFALSLTHQSILCFQKQDFSILEEYATDFFTPTLFQDKTLIATTVWLLSMS